MNWKSSNGAVAENYRGRSPAHRCVRLTGVPTVTVVVASRELRTLDAQLSRLAPICAAAGAEIVVARAGDDDELTTLQTVYPAVRFVSLPEEASRADLLAAGMADADGDIVRLIDDDSPLTGALIAEIQAGAAMLEDDTDGAPSATPPTSAGTATESTSDRRSRPVDRLEAGDRVVIIGSDPGALTAAYLLVKRGVRATVLEASDRVGGLSQTAQYRGYRFDVGGDRFDTTVKPVDDLWHELLEEDLIAVPGRSRIHYGGRFFGYPTRVVDVLLGLGPVETVRVVVSYMRARLRRNPAEDDFEQWATNRFGKRLYRTFFKTYAEKVCGIPSAEIRADWASQQMQHASLGRAMLSAASVPRRSRDVKPSSHDLRYPRLGRGQLWQSCSDRIQALGGYVRLRHHVKALEVEGGRVIAVRAETPEGEVRIAGDHFISSLPIKNLVHALEPAPPAAVRVSANGLSYRDCLTVALIVDGDDLFPDSTMYIQTPEVKVARIQNYNNWSRAMAPEPGRTCLGLEYFCFEGDRLWSLPDDELIALGARDLRHLGLDRGARVLDGTVVRIPKAYPVYDATYPEHLAAVRKHLDPIPNLHLVGRTGMHSCRHQDHSMLVAMLTLASMDGGDYDVWQVDMDAGVPEGIPTEAPVPLSVTAHATSG